MDRWNTPKLAVNDVTSSKKVFWNYCMEMIPTQMYTVVFVWFISKPNKRVTENASDLYNQVAAALQQSTFYFFVKLESFAEKQRL